MTRGTQLDSRMFLDDLFKAQLQYINNQPQTNFWYEKKILKCQFYLLEAIVNVTFTPSAGGQAL